MRLLLGVVLFLGSVWAHPHTFIDLSVTIETEGAKITRMTQKWLYDEMTSSILMMEFDADGNGVLDQKECAYVRDNYLDSIIEQGYFNHITAGGKPLETPPAQFDMMLEKGRLVYLFIFDYTRTAPAFPLSVGFYDEENFVAFDLKNERVKLLPSGEQFRAEAVLKDYVFTLKVSKR